MKTCCKCKVDKHEEEFYRDSGSLDGLQGRCRACMSADSKARYARMTPEERSAYNKAHRDPVVQQRAETSRRARRKADPKQWAEYTQKWNAARRARRKVPAVKARLSLLKKSSTHGLSLEECEARQHLPCGICGKLKGPEKSKRGYERGTMSIDHCHVTGKVRGVLCNHCNRALGLFEDSIPHLEAAIAYLKLYA